MGLLGAALAHHFKLPLAASWHTNVHEYAARRADWFLRLLPGNTPRRPAKRLKIWRWRLRPGFTARPRCSSPRTPNYARCLRATPAVLFPDAARRRRRTLPSRETHARPRRSECASSASSAGFLSRKTSGCWSRSSSDLDAKTKKNARDLLSSATAATRPGCANACRMRSSPASCEGKSFPAPTPTWTFSSSPRTRTRLATCAWSAAAGAASGVPAIVTPDGGPRTIVRDGVTGRIVPDGQFTARSRRSSPTLRATPKCARPRAPMRSLRAGIQCSRESTRRTSA